MYNKLASLGVKTFLTYDTKTIIGPLNLHAKIPIILECEATDWPRYTTTPYIKLVMTLGHFLTTYNRTKLESIMLLIMVVN